jgi:ABC-type glutathione transport system ATPase component
MAYGEVVGLIGESGSGKTTFGKCLLRIVEPSGGQIALEGEDWLALSVAEVQRRRARYQMVYQNPYACLNPGFSVRAHLRETLAVFRGLKGAEAEDALMEELRRFGMESKAGAFPGELSGGEKRRVSVIRALMTGPLLVVADEPTSGLDASVKADVLDAMLAGRASDTAYLFISHDLDVIRFVSDRVLVMYLGRVVEVMQKDRVAADLPHHPYTVRLFEAARAEIPAEGESTERPVDDPGRGCPYRPLCPLYQRGAPGAARCDEELPALRAVHPHQEIACHLITVDPSELALPARGEAAASAKKEPVS